MIPALIATLDEYTKDQPSLKFTWSVLRDNLPACHVYLSTKSILIRPTVPPTKTHSAFANAKQRIYMSATLGAGGDLERLTGVDKIERLPIPTGWDKQGIGRRLFFFPESSLSSAASTTLVCDMIKTTKRSLVLVTNELKAGYWNEKIEELTGYDCLGAAEIETSKDGFVNSEAKVAVIANRYDGIDFVGDECRLSVVDDLPRGINLQERFLMSRLAANVLLNDRIQTRIIQAVGRCTRSATDYAAVVVLGTSLNNYFLDRTNRSFLHPEIQAELDFGIEESKDNEADAFLDNLRIFLEHGEDWNQADEAILSFRDTKKQHEMPATGKLRESVASEVKYQYALWRGDYSEALRHCNSILTTLSGDDVKGYRAFWSYLEGSAAWLGAMTGVPELEPVARASFTRAASTTVGVKWLRELSRLEILGAAQREVDTNLISVIEELENQLEVIGTANDRKFTALTKSILDGLRGADSDAFEASHEKLGKLLGYKTGNTETTAAPDPWWIASDKLCFVFEDHSPERKENVIGANKVRQVASHPKWIEQHLSMHPDAEILPVLISPRTLIDVDATPYAENACYWNTEDFCQWASSAIGVVQELRPSFSQPGNLQWRETAMVKYKDARIDPDSLIKLLKSSLLKNLASPGKKQD